MPEALACVASPAQSTPADGQQQFAALGECKLDNGQQITGCKIGYRTWGQLNADSSNAVLFTCCQPSVRPMATRKS